MEIYEFILGEHMIILDVKIEDNKIDIIQDISTYDLQTYIKLIIDRILIDNEFKISPKFLSLKKDEQHKIIYEKRKEILNYAINNTDVEMEYIHSNITSNYILNKVKEEYGD